MSPVALHAGEHAATAVHVPPLVAVAVAAVGLVVLAIIGYDVYLARAK
jgi:hypothetical protein